MISSRRGDVNPVACDACRRAPGWFTPRQRHKGWSRIGFGTRLLSATKKGHFGLAPMRGLV